MSHAASATTLPDGPLALSWSGGKDSALALHALRAAGRPPELLLTTIDEATQTVPHHGVAVELLEHQARAAGLPLLTVQIPPAAANAAYEDQLRAAFAAPPLDDIRAVAFGDLFLEDLRGYREGRMAEIGRAAAFPLWGRDTGELAGEFIAGGFRAIVVSVDGDQAPHTLLGRPFDEALLADLPPGADPCGERGEFHTFVWDAPVFSHPVPVRAGAASGDARFARLALEPDEARA